MLLIYVVFYIVLLADLLVGTEDLDARIKTNLGEISKLEDPD